MNQEIQRSNQFKINNQLTHLDGIEPVSLFWSTEDYDIISITFASCVQ